MEYLTNFIGGKVDPKLTKEWVTRRDLLVFLDDKKTTPYEALLFGRDSFLYQRSPGWMTDKGNLRFGPRS